MAFRLLTLTLIFLLQVSLHAADTADGTILSVFQKNCVQCHGENDKVKGKVNLLEIKTVEEVTQMEHHDPICHHAGHERSV